MTYAQRSALVGMMQAILAVKHCPQDLRDRAEALADKLDPLASLKRQFGL